MEKTETITITRQRHLDHAFVYLDTEKGSAEPIPEVKVRFSEYDEESRWTGYAGDLESLTPEEAEPIVTTVEKMVLEVYAQRQLVAKQKPAEERTKEEAELAAFTTIEIETKTEK